MYGLKPVPFLFTEAPPFLLTRAVSFSLALTTETQWEILLDTLTIYNDLCR